ncbi:MAG: hypothetical protein ACTHMY_10945 [Solirubrobacteraceae bacterium]
MTRTPVGLTRALIVILGLLGAVGAAVVAVLLSSTSTNQPSSSTHAARPAPSTHAAKPTPTSTATNPAQSSAPQPARLTWPVPALHDPQVIELTPGHTKLVLNLRRDYVLKLPRGHALTAPQGLSVWGGHNVVMVGGTIRVPDKSGAAQLQAQTGTIHIEGVRFSGPRLMEGIDLNEPRGATVELENVYIDKVHGSYTTNHADLIQSWAGPRRLLVDGLMGSTGYQGFFLLPNQLDKGPAPQLFDLRNVYINDSAGAYALWLQTKPRVPLHTSGVYVTPNAKRTWRGWWLWPKPGDATWNQVQAAGGSPTAIQARIARAGINYR